MKIIDHVSLAATLAVLFLIAFVVACGAEPEADYSEGETSAPLVNPQIEVTVGQLLGTEQGRAFLHALKLQMTKYDLDMRSQSGRRSWHGKLIQEVVNTNGLYKIEVYSNEVDGAVWRYKVPFKPVRPKSTGTLTFTTNGIPARLAAARARRAAQLSAGTEVTNIVHEVDVAR